MANAIYPTYEPSRLAPEKARLLNALCIRQDSWRVPFGGGDAEIRLLPDVPAFLPALVVDFTSGGDLWHAAIDTDAICLRHPALSGEAAAEALASALPVEVKQAVLEALCVPMLTAVQDVFSQPVSLQGIRSHQEEGPIPFSLGLRLDLPPLGLLPSQTVFVRLSPASAASAITAAESLRRFPRTVRKAMAETLAAVPLEVAFESGYVFLSQAELAGLGPEDVLIPHVWNGPDAVTLRLKRGASPDLVAPCLRNSGSAVLSAPLSEELEPAMNSPEQNDIDIRLTFELERRVITAGELATLAPGYAFALSSDVQSPVTIRANGKAIASGRLVDMDGTLGVQITETL